MRKFRSQCNIETSILKIPMVRISWISYKTLHSYRDIEQITSFNWLIGSQVNIFTSMNDNEWLSSSSRILGKEGKLNLK